MGGEICKYALILALALAAPAALALKGAPDALLRAVAFEVIDTIKQDQGVQASDPVKIAALVETRVVPLFDFVHMTRLATARNWRLATPEQQRRLTAEFKTLLVRSYSTVLSDYRDQVIEFRNVRLAAADTEVTVKAQLRQAGKERINLEFDMEKTPAGWKIYNVKLAGVRVVASYRDAFGEQIRDGGIDGLIKFLADGNRQGGSRFNSVRSSFVEKSRLLYAILQNMLRGGAQ